MAPSVVPVSKTIRETTKEPKFLGKTEFSFLGLTIILPNNDDLLIQID
jgi:hypothetical protein